MFTALPDVDVVILTWNDGELLGHAVRSAASSVGVRPHLIVVDNGSVPPASINAPEALLVRNEVNRGVAAGRNHGVSLGRSDFVCLLDSDAELEEDSLARLVDVMTADPTIGLVAPVFIGQAPEDSGGQAPTLVRKVMRWAGVTSSYVATPDATGLRDVDFAIGACQLFRRVAYDGVGGLDERYFYGPEDVDFCLRLRSAGWRVVQVAAAAVHHPARRRHRRMMSRAGAQHALAVLRHHWRHRSFRRLGS